MKRILLASLVLSGALAMLGLPALAHAKSGHGPKIDDSLARIADESEGNDTLHVVVFGKDAWKGADHANGKSKRRLKLVEGVSTEIKLKDLEKLVASDDVRFVAADSPVAPQGTVDYSQLATLYPVVDKVTKEAWDSGFNGQGVGIAVIDSGVVPTVDFSGRLVQVPLPWQTQAPNDTHGHGSLVAGIAAGRSPDGKFIGIAPGATVYALNVDRPEGTHSSDVIDALQWVFENAHAYNIRVVNLSLGETVPTSYKQSTLDLAVERLWAAGIVVVVAAGNGGAGAVDYAPSNDPLALSVGATDIKGTKDTKDDSIASFSAYGTTSDGYSKPDLYAPGRLVASVLPIGTFLDSIAPGANRVAPGYATISGTSFSAPQVAGVAALLLQKNPGWSPDNVKAAIVRNARSLSGSSAVALSIDHTITVSSPGAANQNVLALVCAPGSICLPDTGLSTLSSSWNSSSWNSSSWNSSSWNSSSWNSSSWNSSSWNSSSWNSSSWNSSSWNSSSWNSSSWNSFSWN